MVFGEARKQAQRRSDERSLTRPARLNDGADR